jgi:polysaccharide biosynthesis/export protein
MLFPGGFPGLVQRGQVREEAGLRRPYDGTLAPGANAPRWRFGLLFGHRTYVLRGKVELDRLIEASTVVDVAGKMTELTKLQAPRPARSWPFGGLGLAWLLVALQTACGPQLPAAPELMAEPTQAPEYRIAPLDSLNVFVWQLPDLSLSAPVRPDGRISLPLVEDVAAAGKTPTELAREIETKLAEFVQDPIVTIIVTSFGNATDQTVRVVGEAQQPVSVPYRANMTVLDLMVAVGGLTPFAAGNRAVLVRGKGPEQQVYSLRLDDLINQGDVGANTPVLPGDIVIVPKSLL